MIVFFLWKMSSLRRFLLSILFQFQLPFESHSIPKKVSLRKSVAIGSGVIVADTFSNVLKKSIYVSEGEKGGGREMGGGGEERDQMEIARKIGVCS